MNVTINAIRPQVAWALIATSVAAFFAFFLSFQAGVFALIFMCIAWYAWKYPEEGFLLLVILMPILPMLKITQTIGTFSLIKDVIIFALFARVFLRPLLQKTLPYRRNILFAPVVALSLWAIFGTLRADTAILGILRLRDIGLYVMAYFAVLYLPRHDTRTMHRRLAIYGSAVTVTLLLAAWQWFFAVDSAVLRFDPAREIWIPRLSSILAHPSIYGEYLIAAAALALSIAVSTKKKTARAYAAVATVVLLPFIFLTYSRAVWLGLAAAFGGIGALTAWWIIQKKAGIRRLGRFAVVGGVAAILVLVVLIRYTPAGGLLRSIVDPTYGSNEERVEFLVRLVAPLSGTEAVIGSGLGDVTAQNFREIDLGAYDIASGASRAVQLTKNRTLVDNQHLKTFIEMGVVGIGLYLWLYWRFAAAAVRMAMQGTTNAVVGYWSLGFLAAFILQGFFIDIWDIFPTNLLFWVVAALLSQAGNTVEAVDS